MAVLTRFQTIATALTGSIALSLSISSAAVAIDFYTLTDLGTLSGGNNSPANAINDAGQVVGYSNSSSGYRAFLWSSGSGVVDLNTLIDPTLGWTLVGAQAINESGQIVGYGATPDGQTRAC